MQRAQNSTSTSNATTTATHEIAPKRAHDRSAYKLFPDPPTNATPHTTQSKRSSPPTRSIANRARRSASFNDFSKSSMQSVSKSAQVAGSGAGLGGDSAKKAHASTGREVQVGTGESSANTPPVQKDVPTLSSGPSEPGRERSTSLPGAQKPQVNGRPSPPEMNARASPQQRYYARQSGETETAAPAQFQSRVAQVQKLLAAGIKPPPLVTEFAGHQRSSSSSGRSAVGLGLSFGSNATTPDLSMFPAPGKPGAFISRPQSPASHASSGPRSSYENARSRPQSPNGHGSSRPQSPSRPMQPRPQSPSRMAHSRPQSPFAQPPPRPHSPNGYQPRQGSPLSGNSSRPQSPHGYPRTASPMRHPIQPGQSRTPPHDLRVDTSMSTQRPVARPSANHRQMFQHQRQNTDYRRQMQGVQPLDQNETVPTMPQQQRQDREQQQSSQQPTTTTTTATTTVERQSPPQAQQADQRVRGSPPRPQQMAVQQPGTTASDSTLKPPNESRQDRKVIRKSRLQKPLPPPPPPDALLPPAPVLDRSSDTSRESSRPGSPVSPTSSASPVSPVSPMFSQGYGYSTVAANAPSLPSPVSAITSFDIKLPSDAPDVPTVPEVYSKEHSLRSANTTRPPSPTPQSPPLSPPSSKYAVKLPATRPIVSPRRSPSPAETPSPKSATSSDGPHPSDSPVRFEKASSIQIQPLEKPIINADDVRSRASSIRSAQDSIHGVNFGHHRVLSLAPSLIDVKSPADIKRRDVNEKERMSQESQTIGQTIEAEPAAVIATSTGSVSQQTAPASPAAAATIPAESSLVASQPSNSEPVKEPIEAQPAIAQPTPITMNVRSKSSKARDLISKIEQKVQNDMQGRSTPKENSPTPSIISRGPTPKASADNLLLPRKQVATSGQTHATKEIEPLNIPAKSQSATPSPELSAARSTVQAHQEVAANAATSPFNSKPDASKDMQPSTDNPVRDVVKHEQQPETRSIPNDIVSTQPSDKDASSTLSKHPDASTNSADPGINKPDLLSSDQSQNTPVAPPTTNAQTVTSVPAQAGSDSSPQTKATKKDTAPAKQLTSATRLLAAAQQHMKAVKALGQQHQPPVQKTVAANPSNETVKSPTNVLVEPSEKETPRSTTNELPKEATPSSQMVQATPEPPREGRLEPVTTTAKPVKVPEIVTSPHSKSDSMSSYKNFFMQEDIFFSDGETPSHGSGAALPSIQEDGAHEESVPRPSSSTVQSNGMRLPARQMVRDDRSTSRGRTVQSSSSSIMSSHWSRYDDMAVKDSVSGLSGPNIAPFARFDRPSSADTGVLPASENIKISTLPYETQKESQSGQFATKQPVQGSASRQRNDSISRGQTGDIEKLDVVRPNATTQTRPVSAAPPPVPRKDTVRRPVPKRMQNSDGTSTPTSKPASVVDKQRVHIAPDLTRNESHGSTSSINLDAIRARVAGLSERTARAIEAPSKDDISLLSSLEDLAKQSEALHERYASLRVERQKLTNNMTAFLRDVKPGPGYIPALMDQNAALAAVMSSMDICFAKLKSLDCRKEEAIAGLMANVHREPSIAGGRARGMSTSQLKQALLLSREPSNATIVSELTKQEMPQSKSPQPAQLKQGAQQGAQQVSQSASTTPNPASAASTPRPHQGPVDPRAMTSKTEAPAQAQGSKDSPARPRVQGLKAAKVLGLMNKHGQSTDKDVTLPDSSDRSDDQSRLVVNVAQLRQAKTPPPQRPLPTPPARSTSAVNSMHASVMSVASTPEDPDLWTPHEEDDEITPNVLKGPGPGHATKDVRVYAEDDFLEYYRNAP